MGSRCLIANNTLVLATTAPPGQTLYGWRHEYTGQKDASSMSLVQNNVFVSQHTDTHFVEMNGTPSGITADDNVYSGGGVWLTSDKSESFTAWQAAHAGWDVHSKNADALIADPGEFTQSATQKLVYDWSKARLGAGSPAIGAAKTLPQFSVDFTGAIRHGWDAGALSE
jgi:hypothetical protein